ncbi:MAG: thioesterase, partial [Ruminococcus sp.]|nr:thioesterase [Ruminococcus sp.]
NASDDEIVEFFAANSLATSPVTKDEELTKILNKTLCTDVRMAENYTASPDDVRFDCDITVIYGTEDVLMQSVDMNSWNRFTNGSCYVIPMSGGHFYFNQHKEEICSIIKDKLGI